MDRLRRTVLHAIGRSAIGPVLALVTVLPIPVLAQTGVEIRGRVYDAETNGGIQHVIVALEGHGSTLSDEQGTFRFQDVRPGVYTLRVEAFGYENLETSMRVERDGDLPIPLEVAPFQLDSITVELGTLDFDGRARDPGSGRNVMDAQVVSNQGHAERTDVFGGFDLDDAYARVPLRVIIRSFGYLTMDTTFTPDDEKRHDFDLVPDSITLRMIDIQVERLVERAGEHYYQFGPILTRAGTAGYRATWSLKDVMEWTYEPHVLRRIGCFFLDEREITDGMERTHILESTVVNELERVELFEFQGPARLFMVRVYTRRFFQRRIGDDGPMKIPSMNTFTCH